jgi:hypothetical protein
MDSTGSAKPIYEKMNEWQKQHEINAYKANMCSICHKGFDGALFLNN